SILSNVLLPEPLGPMRPILSLSAIRRSRPSTMGFPPSCSETSGEFASLTAPPHKARLPRTQAAAPSSFFPLRGSLSFRCAGLLTRDWSGGRWEPDGTRGEGFSPRRAMAPLCSPFGLVPLGTL